MNSAIRDAGLAVASSIMVLAAVVGGSEHLAYVGGGVFGWVALGSLLESWRERTRRKWDVGEEV